MHKPILIGPFRQLLTMANLPLKGAIRDDQLQLIEHAGIIVENQKIKAIGNYSLLTKDALQENFEIQEIIGDFVAMPGMVDAHTHICYAGSRAGDYAMRLSGMSYLEIAAQGGGIWSTVTKTREISEEGLFLNTLKRAEILLHSGTTTVEIKSGYALNVAGELRMLEIINRVNDQLPIDIVATCLAAHMKPKDFDGTHMDYLKVLTEKLLPVIRDRKLAQRIDIFIEKSAFSASESLAYLQKAKVLGFEITIHADQFTTGGSEIACQIGALSADHLEASTEKEINLLAKSNVIPVCLSGASLGLGMPFAPARQLLDAGASLAIASDWNPGSAPMGDLLAQAAIIGAYEHLSLAETLAAITFRAAAALNLHDRGVLSEGMLADVIAFSSSDYREILYRQGKLVPKYVWKKGKKIF